MNVAVKKLNLFNPNSHWGKIDKKSEFLHEVSMLKKLRHPNVVLFLGYTESKELCIVTEFMNSGSLESFLKKKTLTDKQFK